MKPFKVSMMQNEHRELYGQGETLAEALGNLMHAVDEYGDDSDRESMMEALRDVREPGNRPPRLGALRRPPLSLALELEAHAENERLGQEHVDGFPNIHQRP